MQQRCPYIMLIAVMGMSIAAPTPTDEEETVAPTSAGTGAGVVQNVVTQAKEDLAERLAVDAAGIEVIETQEVVWRDSSLGCPQPGMVYAQVLTDGMLVRLRHGESVYEYHSGGNRGPFLCENPTQDK